jgi:hypothetical protein
MKTEAQLRELYQAAGQVRPPRRRCAPALRRCAALAPPALTPARQGHVFDYWDECDAAEREALLAQLRQIDPHAVNTVRRRPIQRPSSGCGRAARRRTLASCFLVPATPLTMVTAAADLQGAPAHGRRRGGGGAGR